MSAGLARNWWAVGLRALIAGVFGVAVLLLPTPALAALILIFIAYIAADGALAIVAAVGARRRGEVWQTLIFEGTINLTLAGVVLIWPAMAAVVFIRLASAWAIVTGALLLAAARRLPLSHGACTRWRRLWSLGRAGGRRRSIIRGRTAGLGLVADRLCIAIWSDSSGPCRSAPKAACAVIDTRSGQRVGHCTGASVRLARSEIGFD
jgi:hypothetical protein